MKRGTGAPRMLSAPGWGWQHFSCIPRAECFHVSPMAETPSNNGSVSFDVRYRPDANESVFTLRRSELPIEQNTKLVGRVEVAHVEAAVLEELAQKRREFLQCFLFGLGLIKNPPEQNGLGDLATIAIHAGNQVRQKKAQKSIRTEQ